MQYNWITMTVSNLYATRIYSEHPVGLWPIDDDLTYLSLISQDHRDVRTWSAPASIYSSFYLEGIQDPPFPKDTTYLVEGVTGTYDDNGTTRYYVETISQPLFNLYTGINHEQKVFSINAYVYHKLPASFYEIGFIYNSLGEDIRFTERIAAGPPGEWIRLGRTFDHNYEMLDAKIFIRIYYPDNVDTTFMVNGISVGQWSETQSSQSLGVYPIDIPDSTGLNNIYDQNLKGVVLREYGPGLDTGYALAQDFRLLATNGGIPLVYGSNTVTTINASSDEGIKLPSIVVPGKGFLNDSGKFNNYTLEAWVRIDSKSQVGRKIIGPVESNDGIYIRGNSVAIVIGSAYKSFHVGQWYRPMLLHFVVKQDEAFLMINGERVASIKHDPSTAKFPTNRLYNQDWIGFYSWSDIDVFEVDTVSIFPYVVPTAVAKRRFVWGQGVESPETINAAYLGTPHTVDFAYANYSVNVSYPENARWDSGYTDNLVATKNSLTAPKYTLPQVITGKRSLASVLETSKNLYNEIGGPTFITFGETDDGYLFFSDSNKIGGSERSFYAVFSGTSDWGVPLFVFVHKKTGVELRADISNDLVTYSFNGQPYQTAWVNPDQPYVVGFDFSRVNDEIAQFMSNASMVELYVGGYQSETFTGKIYRVGFCSEENTKTISPMFGTDGVIDPNSDMVDYVASYTLAPVSSFGQYYLDIFVSGTWTSTIPLEYFAVDGKIDLLQFNIGSPAVCQVSLSRIDARGPRESARVVDPDATGVLDLTKVPDLMSSTFLVTNNTVLLPPVDIRGLIMTMTLKIDILGIESTQFVLKDMSIASAANSSEWFMDMGTVHGHYVAPYSKTGHYYMSAIDRPWVIYKGSTPYLYLTNDSGLHPLGSTRGTDESGLWITMNRNKSRDFKVSSMQLWLKYSETYVPESPVEIFSVKSDSFWIKFMCVDDGTGLRARVYSIDGFTGQDYTNIRFHQDGYEVIMPFLQNKHWTALGIDFEPLLDLAGDTGAICLLSSCVFNNIVFYQTSSIEEQYTYAYRTWAEVKNDGTSNLIWSYWKSSYAGGGATWDEVSKTATISHGISVDEIYKTYVGTNRVVVGDNSMLLFEGGQVSAISHGITTVSDQYHTKIDLVNPPEWKTLSIKPV